MTRRLLFLSGVFLLAAAVAGVAQPRLGRAAESPPAGRSITVNGTGTVTTVPDRATFTFGADARAATAKAAIAQANDAVDAVVAALKKAGVAAADLQTSQISLNPQTSDDGTRVTGYVASSSVTATTSIANAGPLVDAAVDAGATSVSGPSLSRADSDALYRDALKQAVDDARTKAQTLAAGSGLTLGAVRTVVEGGSAMPMPLGIATGAAKIEPGTQTIEASVTVTFDAA
jgi:uncharacterized protein YggE